MKLISSRTFAAVGVLALASIGTAAQAHVSVGIGLNVPVAPMYAPQPAYVYSQPAYVAAPQPVYVQPQPVYVAPPPMYAAPPALSIYYGPGYRGWHRGYRHHHGR